jgi:predicted DNA-binding transcriptional regulator YafY
MRDVLLKQKIEFAITQHKLVQFDYVSGDLGITRSRLVEPTGFDSDRFYGYDLDKKDKRVFVYKGVMQLQVVNKL